MEHATSFVVVAAAHPSLDDAVGRFCATLRAEARSFGRRDQTSPRPTVALVRRLEVAAPGISLAALLDGEIIGLARVDESAAEGPDLIIAVAAAWRHRGVATALGRAIVSRAHAAGVPRIVVRATHGGTPQHQFDDESGFLVFEPGRGRLDLVRSVEPAMEPAIRSA